VPRDWRALLEDGGRPDKERVTLRLDADMVKFFRRRWGRGYQKEVNLVLRSFFKLHMSKMVKGDDGFEALLEEARKDPREGAVWWVGGVCGGVRVGWWQ
jgi:hypothetical protein